MSNKDTITLPREVVEKAIKAFENGCPSTCENGMIDSGGFHPWGEPMLDLCPACLAFEHLRTALATEQPKPEALEVAYEFETHVLFGSGSTISRTLLEKAVTTLRRLYAENEALRRDAERWRFYETAGGDLTGRLHNTRSDHRKAVIDAAMEDK